MELPAGNFDLPGLYFEDETSHGTGIQKVTAARILTWAGKRHHSQHGQRRRAFFRKGIQIESLEPRLLLAFDAGSELPPDLGFGGASTWTATCWPPCGLHGYSTRLSKSRIF